MNLGKAGFNGSDAGIEFLHSGGEHGSETVVTHSVSTHFVFLDSDDVRDYFGDLLGKETDFRETRAHVLVVDPVVVHGVELHELVEGTGDGSDVGLETLIGCGGECGGGEVIGDDDIQVRFARGEVDGADAVGVELRSVGKGEVRLTRGEEVCADVTERVTG